MQTIVWLTGKGYGLELQNTHERICNLKVMNEDTVREEAYFPLFINIYSLNFLQAVI